MGRSFDWTWYQKCNYQFEIIIVILIQGEFEGWPKKKIVSSTYRDISRSPSLFRTVPSASEFYQAKLGFTESCVDIISARGLYHRSGITPCPEGTEYSIHE